ASGGLRRGLRRREQAPPRPCRRDRERSRPCRRYLVALAREARTDAQVSLDRDLLDAGLTDPAIERPAAFLGRLREPSSEQTSD
ncbi:MAG: hypothetical protein DLM61_24455, partial [Pseudonocardiales bacterium]